MVVSDKEVTFGLLFLHMMTVFNMEIETSSSFEVPDFVPVGNQILVFLNTGTKQGVLVAWEGYREKNGRFELVGHALPMTSRKCWYPQAPLSSIFLYDISSELWTEQEVTDQHGHSVEDETIEFELSHNFLVLEGQNETHPRQDA